MKYYGSLLTSSVDAALLNGAEDLTEDNIVSTIVLYGVEV